MKYIITIALTLFQVTLVLGQKIDSVNVEGLTVFYETEGSGEPVYLLAGGPGLTPYYMKAVSAELSKNHQTVLIHQRGTGLTKVPVNEQTIGMNQFMDDIKAVKEKLNHQKIILMGHSWGGMLAMNYAALHPDEIDKLILVSSGSPDLSFYNFFVDNIRARLSEDDQYSSQVLLNLSQMAGSENESNHIFFEFQILVTKGYFYDKSKAQEMGTMSAEDFNLPAFNLMIGFMHKAGWDLKQDLGKPSINTLIIHGRQDPVGIETATLINQTIPNSKLSLIEKCGHFPWIEQPDIFFKTVNEFVGRSN